MKMSIYFELFVLDAEAPTRLCTLVLFGGDYQNNHNLGEV